jgi:hypothetical protein
LTWGAPHTGERRCGAAAPGVSATPALEKREPGYFAPQKRSLELRFARDLYVGQTGPGLRRARHFPAVCAAARLARRGAR